MNDKKLVAQSIADQVQDGQVIGVGTGSTVSLAIPAIAKKVKAEKLSVSFISTSIQTTEQLFAEQLTVLDFNCPQTIDWGFDGADAVDSAGNLIKGKGGAMLIEKIMAKRAQQYYVIIDSSKIAKEILLHCSIPVEVIPAASQIVQSALQKVPGFKSMEMRMAEKKHGPVITEAGNLILDLNLTEFNSALEDQLKQITGVVETGLFIGYADQIITAEEGQVSIFFKR